MKDKVLYHLVVLGPLPVRGDAVLRGRTVHEMGRARMTARMKTVLLVVLGVAAVLIVLWALFTQGLEARVT